MYEISNLVQLVFITFAGKMDKIIMNCHMSLLHVWFEFSIVSETK